MLRTLPEVDPTVAVAPARPQTASGSSEAAARSATETAENLPSRIHTKKIFFPNIKFFLERRKEGAKGDRALSKNRMSALFGKRQTTKDLARQTKSQTRRSQMELDREMATLNRQEKQLIAEIKKAAAMGQKPVVNTLTKQLIRVRKQKQQLLATKSAVTGVQYQTQAAVTNERMMTAMGGATRAMARANAAQDPRKMAMTMQQYQMQQEKMGMTQEMMDDMLEGDADEEEEADAVVDEVFDELGLEIEGKMASVPKARAAAVDEEEAPRRTKTKTTGDAELDKLLAQL